MEKDYIKLQGVDICTRQIDYIEFGLKQSKTTPFLVFGISTINHLLEDFYEEDFKDDENFVSLLNRIGIWQ